MLDGKVPSRAAVCMTALTLAMGAAACSPDSSADPGLAAGTSSGGNSSQSGSTATGGANAGTNPGGAQGGSKPSGGGGGSTAQGGSDASGSGGGPVGGGPVGGGPVGGAPNESGGVIAAGVRWFGRVDVSDAKAIKFAWTGSGFVGTFTGPSVAVKLKTVGGGEVYFQPVVDGMPQARFGVGSSEQTIEIAKNLAAGEHRIELFRETEGKGFGYSEFSGFSAGTPGAPPDFSGRLIEVIGDSISAGYGNLGVEQHPNYGPDPNGGCTFTTETESGYLAYGPVAARGVGADASVLAGSGWGVYSDGAGDTDNVMPKLFGNTLGEQATPSWSFAAKAQAVVINLGTNDVASGSLSAGTFKPAYTAFVTTIREKYPDALILCAVGSMLAGTDRENIVTYLNQIITELGDAKLKLLDLGSQDAAQGTGCEWHPNVADNARMAGLLRAELEASLGW